MFTRIVIPLVTLAAALGVHARVLAQDTERGCISLKTVAEIEESYVDERGNAAKRLVPASKVLPGDEVIWTIVADNVCATPAGDVAITNPVPAHMHYVSNSAFGPGATIEFSLDGSEFAAADALTVAAPDGSRRTARAEEYQHIRWALPRPLGPSEQLIVRYRAVVL